jgi:hypothetical protein
VVERLPEEQGVGSSILPAGTKDWIAMSAFDDFRKMKMQETEAVNLSLCFDRMYAAKTERERVQWMEEASKLLAKQQTKDPW